MDGPDRLLGDRQDRYLAAGAGAELEALSQPADNPARTDPTGARRLGRRFGRYAMQQQSPPEQLDLAGMVADLNSLLRLKTTVIGMKMFATVEEMTAVPKIRRPTAVHTTDQIVS